MGKAIRILIVEDNEDTRKLMRVALDDGERRIYEARNAAEGRKLAAEVRPDVLLLDIGLPGSEDGLTLCKTLLSDAQHKDLYVVVVTGSDSSEHIERARSIGASAYLIKPFSTIKLRTLVSDIDIWVKNTFVVPPADVEVTKLTWDDLSKW